MNNREYFSKMALWIHSIFHKVVRSIGLEILRSINGGECIKDLIYSYNERLMKGNAFRVSANNPFLTDAVFSLLDSFFSFFDLDKSTRAFEFVGLMPFD